MSCRRGILCSAPPRNAIVVRSDRRALEAIGRSGDSREWDSADVRWTINLSNYSAANEGAGRDTCGEAPSDALRSRMSSATRTPASHVVLGPPFSMRHSQQQKGTRELPQVYPCLSRLPLCRCALCTQVACDAATKIAYGNCLGTFHCRICVPSSECKPIV